MNVLKLPLSLMLGLVVVVLLCYLPSTAAGTNATLSPAAAGQSLDDSPRLVLEGGGHLAVIRALLFTADGRELVSVSDDHAGRSTRVG